jgi:hypothetical protein
MKRLWFPLALFASPACGVLLLVFGTGCTVHNPPPPPVPVPVPVPVRPVVPVPIPVPTPRPCPPCPRGTAPTGAIVIGCTIAAQNLKRFCEESEK